MWLYYVRMQLGVFKPGPKPKPAQAHPKPTVWAGLKILTSPSPAKPAHY